MVKNKLRNISSRTWSKSYRKTFTLDKNMIGPDHLTSLNPKEFTKMIKLIRRSEIMLGSQVKKLL